jgi:Rieske Fe-S protein
MTEDEVSIQRRGFLKIFYQILVATGLTALAAPIIAFFWPSELEEIPSEPVPVGPVDSIPVGEAKTIRYGRYPAMVLNLPEEGLVAFSAVCTHFACIVKWNQEIGMIECPCHEGYFDPIDGSVISGPPPEPLLPIPIFIEADTLFIGGEA